MLRISQHILSNTTKRHISTVIRRVAPATTPTTRNVKTSLPVIAATALTRQQQPWKLASLYYGSKRFYVGKVF